MSYVDGESTAAAPIRAASLAFVLGAEEAATGCSVRRAQLIALAAQLTSR